MVTTTYRVPDLHARRYRRPAAGTVNAAMFAHLRSQIPALVQVSDPALRKLLRDVNQTLWETMIQHPDGVELPSETGHLFLAACPARRADSIDYKASQALKQLVRQRNFESDGFLAKIFFSTTETRYLWKHHELWGFAACKNFRHAVGQQFPRQWQMYARIEPDKKLKNTFHQQKKALEHVPAPLTDYDELSF